VLGAMLLSWAVALQARGVAVVGSVPAGLPSLGVPDVKVLDAAHLVPAAVGIFFVSFADEILTARSFAGRRNQHIRASQELLAMAAANASAGLSQGFSVGASGSRTSVNDNMGARTQVSCLVAAAAVVVILVFLTGPVSYLPKPVLAAVIVAAGIALIDPAAWRALESVDRVEVAIAGVTAASVILVGVLEAIVFAAGLSIVDVVRRSARPHDAVLGWSDKLGRYADVSVHRSARVTPGVLVYRLDDRIFFANARYVRGRINEALQGAPHPVHWLVFDAEAVTHVDATGLATLEELVRECRREGVGFAVARLKRIAREGFDDSGLTDLIGRERFYWTVREAVEDAPSGPAPDHGSPG
jgi:MFS superfamily sulfate permease-like transporter